MSALWIPLIFIAVIFYGIGQVLAKKATSRIDPGSILLLFAFNTTIIWGGYWILFHRHIEAEPIFFFYGFLAAFFSSTGYIFYFEALARGSISIVGTVTAAYSAITVPLA